jgi:hypothetical protein
MENKTEAKELVSGRVYDSVEDAVNELKLDRRYKWKEWRGELIYTLWYTSYCTGCTECGEMTNPPAIGSGCHECGYTGKRRSPVPIPATMPDGSPVKIQQKII